MGSEQSFSCVTYMVSFANRCPFPRHLIHRMLLGGLLSLGGDLIVSVSDCTVAHEHPACRLDATSACHCPDTSRKPVPQPPAAVLDPPSSPSWSASPFPQMTHNRPSPLDGSKGTWVEPPPAEAVWVSGTGICVQPADWFGTGETAMHPAAALLVKPQKSP